jgi:hypothetical protein
MMLRKTSGRIAGHPGHDPKLRPPSVRHNSAVVGRWFVTEAVRFAPTAGCFIG